MLEGDHVGPRRLPFRFEALGGVGRLALENLPVGPLIVDRLELEVTDLGTDPGAAVAERYQRRRTRLRSIAMRVTAARLEERLEQVRRHLAGLGVSQISARLNDGFVSVRARAADGLAAADLSFRIHFVSAGTHLRAVASTVRVHGHLPSPGPLVADRILVALLGATDAPNVVERPHARGLCDVEIDLVGALLWHMLPPSGWRLPAVGDVELVQLRIGRSSLDVTYGPAGTRSGELGVRPQTHQLAAAHDLMHSADQQLREGHFEEAMRGYRALLAAGGPEQPLLLERILSLAAARPAWFFDGLELSRQALGRWPHFPAAHAALASIMLAQGDAREAAGHLMQLAQLASGEGDDDQTALAALAGARLLRVLEPKAATQLYELALEHDPSSLEAADSLVDRLADEHRWPELVRLVRARAVITSEPARAVQLRLRLADVFVHQLGDPASAQQELAVARHLAPDDPSVHEMAATVLATIDPAAAIDAWRDVARLAEARGDHRTCSRAWAIVGDMLSGAEAEEAWARALALDPLQSDALAGLATAAAARGDHAGAADLYERLRGLGLPQHTAARYELELARSLVSIGRVDDARASLRRATLAGGETAAEAHAVLAEVAEATSDREHAAAELDTAIASLVGLATDDVSAGDRLYTRAAELAVARANLMERSGQPVAASADWIRAHELAQQHAPEIARDAARTLLARSGDDAITERRWIDAVLATRPPPHERASLLVRRAEVRRREPAPDIAAAIADLHEALQLTEDGTDEEANEIRRRAYHLEADLLAQSGDRRARAQALSALAKMAERNADRVEVETAAAAAWLAADEPATALPHGARAHAELRPDVPPALRREVLVTLGEAAWRQRAWPDVVRAYKGLIEDPGSEAPRIPTFRYRLAVAADRSGDSAIAVAALRPLVEDPEAARGATPELRAQALRLFADLAERSGDLGGAATALEGFAALADDSSPTARADAMYRAGELFRRADRGEDAIRCLEAALRISDTHMPALDALENEWRARGDIERVSVILGRKVAATGRHPARQKPLLSRLGDLQDQLGRPEVALAAHQRALEIDPAWRPSLRYVTLQLQSAGQLVAAAGGLAQLSAELPGDSGVDLAIVARERQLAAAALSELVAALEPSQIEAIRELARPALERANVDGANVAAGLAKLRGETPPSIVPDASDGSPDSREENTASGRATAANGSALSLRDAATRERLAGKLDEAFATLETANHVKPGDPLVLQDLVELATETGDHEAAARHMTTLAELSTGARRGNALLELAEIYYDRLDDAALGRQAMRGAADAFGKGARRDATLRMLASEARANLAWDTAVEALSAISDDRRSAADITDLATALLRAGRDGEALTVVEQASAFHRFDDGGVLLGQVRAELERKSLLAKALEERASMAARVEDATAMRQEAAWIRNSMQESRVKTLPGTGSAAVPPAEVATPEAAEERRAIGRIKLISVPAAPAIVESEPPSDDAGWQSVSDPRIKSGPIVVPSDQAIEAGAPAPADDPERERLMAAHRADPDEPELLLPLLAYLVKEPELRREILEHAAKTSHSSAQAIALHELALLAREGRNLIAAAAYWTRAYEVDSTYAPVWMPLADALAASDEIQAARELYEQVSQSTAYDGARRAFAADRAAALGHDDSIVSGEIGSRPADPAAPVAAEEPAAPARPQPALSEVDQLADAGDLRGAIALAEQIAAAAPDDPRALEVLERLYFKLGDVTAASEAIGRQLVMVDDDLEKARLWRRRAKMYRDSLNRDAETYRCLKEAHACSPADPEIAYQLRTAAMVRGEWALAASLLYREIAAATNPRDRGALHLELALIYDERLDDDAQAQVNFEQSLAFDPTIPAAKLPLARRYETIGRFADAMKLYEEAATTARAADRGALLEAVARCRTAATANATADDGPDTLRDPPGGTIRPNFEGQLVRAEAAGDLDAVLDIATQLWRADPGNPFAFRVLAKTHRASGDLPALSDLTSVRASRAETADDRAAAWLEVARLAEELGALDQAARAYDLALVEDPSHIAALDARGSLAFSLGDFATADTIYRDLAPGDSVLGADELSLRRSIISERLGRDTEALTQAQQAAETAPNRRDVMMRVQELATRIGDLDTALEAARAVLDLVPIDDDEAKIATHFALVDLLRQSGNLDGAIGQLDRVLRDHPQHAASLEALAEIHAARGDWPTATRYLYQLVPLAPSALQRAERLFRLGEAVLVHLGDVDRADDVFLRASDLDPTHVPTLRRLLDVYWRADDPGALVEVAAELAEKGALSTGLTADAALAHALVAAALIGDTQLASTLQTALGDDAPRRIAAALGELTGREGRLQLATASTAIAELARRGMLDLAKVRAAAAGTPVANLLTSS